MTSPGDVSERTDKLCEQCSNVNFSSLFSPEMKAFWIGTLLTIVGNDTCPFCRLIIHAINDSWMGQFSEIWSTTNLDRINIWVKTTFWAHCDCGNEIDSKSYWLQRDTVLRFRPALGTDWMLEDRKNGWNSSIRSTICELDCISTEKILPFCNELRQDCSQVLRRRLISDVVDISLIQSWIEECQGKHKHFAQQAKSQAQLRVTGQFLVYDVVKSRLMRPTKYVEYIALSYVWGDALRQRQLAEPDSWWSSLFDDDEHSQWTEQGRHVRFDKLPRAVQDASWLLQRIGRRYLWVDLLCVCQDDASKKELLINRMHVVYEGASFSIVAAGGKDADSPLHGLHKDTRSSERTWTIPTKGGDLSLTPARPELKDLLSSTHWITRGWTFQEDILSSCCLYFTRNEIFYSCDYHSPQSSLPHVGYFTGFHDGRFNEWREGYALETRLTRTAYQSMSPWNDGWSRYPTRGLRCNNSVIRQLKEANTGIFSRSRSAMSDDFHEYAAFVGEYTQRNLTEPGDIISAFMGILSKFGTKFGTRLPLGADVPFHGLLDYNNLLKIDIYNNILEMALLWIPSEATALRRRCINPGPGRTNTQQFPSWAWSGWVGKVDYPVKNSRTTPSGVGDLDGQSSWVFSPATFSAKVEPIRMHRLFKWSSRGIRRVIAWLSEFEDRRDDTPMKGLNVEASCTLTMFTHVAKVERLAQQSGFMAQNYRTWGDHHFCNIYSTRGNGSDCAAIFPDSGTQIFENEYKLVCIGKGQWEWVVLLIEQKGHGYERIGLTTVLPDTFEWGLQWIDIV